MNEKFGDLNVPVGLDKKDGNCGVVALASVTNLSLAEVKVLYRKLNPDMRKNRTRRDGYKNFSTGNMGRMKVLNHLGIKYKTDSYGYLGFSLIKFVTRYAKLNVTYMVTTRNHVQMVRNGIVMDQGGPKSIREFWGRRRRIAGSVLIFD
jgi:hypothetical protein